MIRCIALSDNIDAADRNSTAMDMMPIMNVFNEWHSANKSKKIRAVLNAGRKQAAKDRQGQYPNSNALLGAQEVLNILINLYISKRKMQQTS